MVDIFRKFGIEKNVESTTWSTILTLGACFEYGPDDVIDMPKVGQRVSEVTGKSFRASGNYNRVFAHLMRLVEFGLVRVDASGAEPLFSLGDRAFKLGRWLRENGWLPYLMSPESKRRGYALITLAAINVEDYGELEPIKLYTLPFSESQAQYVLRDLRNGFSVRCPKTGAQLVVATNTVRRFGRSWVRNRQLSLPLQERSGVTTEKPLVATADPSPPVVVVDGVPLDSLGIGRHDDVTELDLDTLLDDRRPVRKPPRHALDSETVPDEVMPSGSARLFFLDEKFLPILDKEAQYLGLRGQGEVLSYYLNKEWGPGLEATQNRREEQRQAMIRHKFARRREELEAALSDLDETGERIQKAQAELETARSLHEAQEREAKARLVALEAELRASIDNLPPLVSGDVPPLVKARQEMRRENVIPE